MSEGRRSGGGREREPRRGETETSPEAWKSIEQMVKKRWEAIAETLKGFEERETQDALNPKFFVENSIIKWKERHENSENIEISSPFERIVALLALLVEKGAEWPSRKKAAVRRMMIAFAAQARGAMKIPEQNILSSTILAGAPSQTLRPGEQELVDQWLEETIGRGE